MSNERYFLLDCTGHVMMKGGGGGGGELCSDSCLLLAHDFKLADYPVEKRQHNYHPLTA